MARTDTEPRTARGMRTALPWMPVEARRRSDGGQRVLRERVRSMPRRAQALQVDEDSFVQMNIFKPRKSKVSNEMFLFRYLDNYFSFRLQFRFSFFIAVTFDTR